MSDDDEWRKKKRQLEDEITDLRCKLDQKPAEYRFYGYNQPTQQWNTEQWKATGR